LTIIATKFRTARLGEQLAADGLLTPEQLQEALGFQAETGVMLGEAIATLGYLTTAVLGPYLERMTGFPFVNLTDCDIDDDLARSIPEPLARHKQALPFAYVGDSVQIAMVDPLDLKAVDELRARLNRRIIPCLTFAADLTDAINRIHDGKRKAQSVLDEIQSSTPFAAEMSVDELVGMADDAPIVRLVNSILHSAISSGASDIHIEPQEYVVRVRFRQDGLLYDQMNFPRGHLPAVVSRLKVMAQLDIAERRRPQDGRFSFRHENGSQYDLRVSLMPLIYGEKAVMRILEKTNTLATAEKLGFFPEQREVFESCIQRPNGIILVTGPTGSGKSTTLYAALNRINDASRNINTVEDPVEYNLPGVNQVQVHHSIGMTFAASLRALVRQDPDVIMVGEIRDVETAEIAIQAALTGHLVLSTLHTNDAPGAIIRLQNMGVEPFLISSAVIAVVGQRLLRTVCSACKEVQPAMEAMLDAFGITPRPGDPPPVLATGAGCIKCGGRGMRGRTAVYEIMQMSDALREMTLKRLPGSQLRAQAISEGMLTMRDAGLRKALEGATTIDEVSRVLFTDDF
jgi:type IV pilus assembly protein PilB